MINIVWSSRFVRAFKKIIKQKPYLKSEIIGAIKLLQDDIFHPKLYTHKLKGPLTGCWTCSVEYDVRIVFEIEENPYNHEQEILLLSIGTHEQVY
ncbi:MAG: type II toxin-antitoxin system mRNA interferase toxin, RelE/StbE family [bacterium]